MWSGWALYILLITNNDVTITYQLAQFNFKQECIEAEQEVSEALDSEPTINKYKVLCREHKQDFDNSILQVNNK